MSDYELDLRKTTPTAHRVCPEYNDLKIAFCVCGKGLRPYASDFDGGSRRGQWLCTQCMEVDEQ